MYLKSLVLKGFKSFADRSVLSLEPGITAVVGPNGSGKSNISDAVLWVLGERNARHLRGQAMEDVIFSGSSARKQVSVAEVELILDNSDHTLPVEFDEVSIARRMYRTGESEYLINGSLARRMDVLDILHDTGLGSGTHSIISQGSLDTVLQSRPEDRRALIEEAAGVLKHKQRKDKSARKLEAMDNHLARVRDVTAEINRQLGPLERKAKRARAYEEASSRLSEVKLALAVDDLRTLQKKWNEVCEAERLLGNEVSAKRAEVESAEQKMSDIQELIRSKSLNAGELARSQRKASSVAERLDSASLLLRQKRSSAESYEADIVIALENARAKMDAAKRELSTVEEQYKEASSKLDLASSKLDDVQAKRNEVYEKRKACEREVDECEKQQRNIDRELDDARRKLSRMKDDLSSGLANEKLVDARRSEVDSALAEATEEHDRLARELASALDALRAAEQENKKAQDALGEAFSARDIARAERDAVVAEERMLQAEIKALAQALRANASDDPALIWLMDNADSLKLDLKPLSHALGAPSNLESLVERILGEDLSALMVRDATVAKDVVDALLSQSRAGDVSVMLKNDSVSSRPNARNSSAGAALVDKLSYKLDDARVVEALLGDVVICATREEAFSAHEADELGLRFATADGCVIWPEGKVRVFGAIPEDHEGVLARERKLEESRRKLDAVHEKLASENARVEQSESAYRIAQDASLKTSQELARVKGVVESARADESRSESRMKSLARECESIKTHYESALKAVSDLRPAVEALEGEIEIAEQARKSIIERREEAMAEVVPLRREAGRLNDALSEAKLELATQKERTAYAERIVSARKRDIDQAQQEQGDSHSTLVRKRVAQNRAVPVLSVLDALSTSLRSRVRAIDDAVLASESDVNGVQASADRARAEAKLAHDNFDETNSRMTQIRVEKGRIEVQVEAAVDAVTEECDTPLDVAQSLPVLEDRASVEEESLKLERKIKNMGTINPDAAEEHEKLKERYDYFMAQLEDMESARRSLAKVVRIIDARMRDDFVNTFEQVNKNFSEIFATLFPGGSGSLVLENPDDIENTGIEIKAQPRGKRVAKMSLMSGGERSLIALCLLFSIYRIRSTPFYILDEVEAALDDSNLRRLIAYIDSLRDTTQLIMITHQRRSMEMADVLFGVSMQADGVTKVISQKLEHALAQAE